MKKLDRFILKTFVGPFVAILLVVLFILVMQFLWLYIDELVGKGLSMKTILEFLAWGSATLLPMALPLATLLSSMMALGNLAENNELLAIKAAGVSLSRVLTPLILVSVIISIGAFFAANNLIPVAYNKIYTLRDDILRTKEEIKIPAGTFYNGIDGYILRVDDRDDKTGVMHGVIVYDHTSNKGNVSMTLADSAMMKISDDKTYLTFELFHGTNYEETNTRKYRDTTLQLQQIDFNHQEMLIQLENYAFKKSEEGRFSDEVKSMKLGQLYEQKDSLDEMRRNILAEHIEGVTTTRTFHHNVQIDTSRHSRATVPFVHEEFLEWSDLGQKIEAYSKAANAGNEYVATLTGYARDDLQYSWILRRVDEGILKKFAGALACFLFFFIGAPLGALIRKGGLGTPAIISCLFFVLYWVVDVSGTKLARDGAVTSFNGVFTSTYVLIPIGAFLTWKAITDSPIFNMDNIKSGIRKALAFVTGLFRKPRIVYMGTPEFAVAPLDALIRTGRYNVVAVVTVPDKASGRGLKMNESAVKKYASEHGIPVLQPEKMKDPGFIGQLKSFKPDIFVVVAFRMLPKVVWEIPRLGTFNLHAALLPQYRGAAPINWAVINGESSTGVTTFLIDEGIDTGKILLREQCAIRPEDNAGDVHDRLMAMGASTVVQTVEGLLEKNLEVRLQRTFIQGSEILRPAPKLSRELCHIDWNAPVADIHNLIRGLSPYPGAFTELVRDGAAPVQMKIFSSEKFTSEEFLAAHPGLVRPGAYGSIVSDGKTFFGITTSDGVLSVRELQMAGKKRMAVDAFLLGFRDPESWSVTKGSSAGIIASVRG